jgi:signal transduction histidine kinase
VSTLRTRFLVAFVVAALLPTAVVGWWSRETIVEQTEAEYEQRLSATVDSAERRVEARRTRDMRAIGRLCERDFVIDRLILDLAAGRFGPARQDELVSLMPSIQRSLGLDTLEILFVKGPERPRGRVLGSAHFPGRAGATDGALLEAVEQANGEPFIRSVRVRKEGRARNVRTVLTACQTERDEVRIAVVGGHFLDDQYVESLLGDVRPVHLVLAGPDGQLQGEVPAGGKQKTVHTFSYAGGEPAARLVAVIDTGPLRARLAQLDRVYLVGGLVALVAALLLATVLVMGLTRPLRELEAAARRVGEGDLESTINVRHGGEVGRALSAFNRMTEELKTTRERLLRAERIAAWRDIARRIAHEIKNPLSPIQVSIETMRKTYAKGHPDFDEIFQESTATILEEVERLRRIVAEFSRFARLPRPSPEWLELRELGEHVVGLHQGGEVQIHLEDHDPPQVRADREQLTQVLVNLVQNASDAARARHGSHGGHVILRLEPDEETGGARIRVQDNGPGIPAEQRNQIFEPYYTSKAGGTGLGLAIVHRIIGDHGGHVEVQQSPDGGAEFVMVLRPEGPPPEVEASVSDSGVPLVQRRD